MSRIPLRLVLSLPTRVGGTDLERTCSTAALPTLFKADPGGCKPRDSEGEAEKITNGNIPLHGERKPVRCSTPVIQKEGSNSSAYRPKDEPS